MNSYPELNLVIDLDNVTTIHVDGTLKLYLGKLQVQCIEIRLDYVAYEPTPGVMCHCPRAFGLISELQNKFGVFYQYPLGHCWIKDSHPKQSYPFVYPTKEQLMYRQYPTLVNT